jgi:hypothetical protein
MFTEEQIEIAWNHAKIVEGYDAGLFRKDAAGAWIAHGEYGNRDSKYGWEIDHIYPSALGGDENTENLRAMQWENNVSKGDDYPVYWAAVIADGNVNVDEQSQRVISVNLQQRLAEIYDI